MNKFGPSILEFGWGKDGIVQHEWASDAVKRCRGVLTTVAIPTSRKALFFVP